MKPIKNITYKLARITHAYLTKEIEAISMPSIKDAAEYIKENFQFSTMIAIARNDDKIAMVLDEQKNGYLLIAPDSEWIDLPVRVHYDGGTTQLSDMVDWLVNDCIKITSVMRHAFEKELVDQYVALNPNVLTDPEMTWDKLVKLATKDKRVR